MFTNKKVFLTYIVLIFLIIIVNIETTVCQVVAPGKYKIEFKNKNNNYYTIDNPSAFLSSKAIVRRNNQGISINSLDLPISLSYLDSIRSTGVKIISQSKWLNSIIITNYNSTRLEQIFNFTFVKPLEEKSRLNIIPKDIIERPSSIKSIYTKNLSLIPLVENELSKVFNYNYGNATNQVQMIKVNELHNLGFNGSGITIAIIDGGFFEVNTINAFDSIRNNRQILGTKDFVSSGNNVYNENYHGMAVLSCIAANKPGSIIGTAPKANFWLLRSEDTGSEYLVEEYYWAAAAEFADSVGVDVINSSLGYTVFDDASQNHSISELDGKTTPISKVATIASSKGIIVVNSAGNEGNNTWKHIGFPADADSILTVGAVNSSGNYASFSSIGPSTDNRIKPDVVAQGANTTLISSMGSVTTGNGTSFSGPIMAGAVACLKQAFPNATVMQIINAIKKSSSQYLSPNNTLGYGIPDMSKAFLFMGNKTANASDNNKINLYPNPFHENLKMMYFSNNTDEHLIEIYNLLGEKIYEKTIYPEITGFNLVLIDQINSIPTGMYIFKMSDKENSTSTKITKVQR